MTASFTFDRCAIQLGCIFVTHWRFRQQRETPASLFSVLHHSSFVQAFFAVTLTCLCTRVISEYRFGGMKSGRTSDIVPSTPPYWIRGFHLGSSTSPCRRTAKCLVVLNFDVHCQPVFNCLHLVFYTLLVLISTS